MGAPMFVPESVFSGDGECDTTGCENGFLTDIRDSDGNGNTITLTIAIRNRDCHRVGCLGFIV